MCVYVLVEGETKKGGGGRNSEEESVSFSARLSSKTWQAICTRSVATWSVA